MFNCLHVSSFLPHITILNEILKTDPYQRKIATGSGIFEAGIKLYELY